MDNYDPYEEPQPYGDPQPNIESPRSVRHLPVVYKQRPVCFMRSLVSSTLVLVVWHLAMLFDLYMTHWQAAWHIPPFMRFLLTTSEYTLGVLMCGWALYVEAQTDRS